MRTFIQFFASVGILAASLGTTAGSIWFDNGGSVSRLDTSTGQVAAQISATPKNMATGSDGTLWILGQNSLRKYSLAGVNLVDLGLQTDDLAGAKVLTRDRYSAGVWVADVKGVGQERLIVQLDAQGNRVSEFATVGGTRSIAVDLAPTVWLLTNQEIVNYSVSGATLATVNLQGVLSGSVQLMALDAPRKIIWIAAGSQIARIDATAPNATAQVTSLSASVVGIDVDQETGAVWVAMADSLNVYASDGSFIRTIATNSLGAPSVKTVAFDATTGLGWVGYTAGLASFTRAGALGTNLSSQAVSRIATTAFIPLPTVVITAPAAGAVYTAPATFTVTATASQVGLGIASVEFFRNGASIGTAGSSPYQVSVSNLGPGTYSLTAVATDTRGVSAASSAVSITVNNIANSAPTVSITAPATGTVIAAPASFTLTADAADSDGTIAKVDFYQGASLIGTATSAPYSLSVASLSSGTYSYTAKATDNLGATTTSAVVQVISDALPAVSITTPANNALFTAPATISLTASASDSDGTISKVEFFHGATLVGTVTSAPYTASVSGLAAGSYIFTAKATDNLGLATTSAAITVLVNSPPAASITAPANNAVFAAPAGFTVTADASDSDGSITKVEFFQGATLIGTVTAAPYSVNVSGLVAGTYSYTAKATDNQGAATTSALVQVTSDALPSVSLTAPANNAVFTAPATVSLTATASDSDGTVSKVEFFQGASLVATVTSAPYTASVSGLAAGSYTFTAKATDNLGLATTSAPVSVSVNSPPAVSITTPANNAVFAAPASFSVTADASDSDGSITKVEFFQGATLIATVTAAPYAANVSSLVAGSYTFTAKATDNLGATTTSGAVQVLVDALPSVSLTAPANNAVFTAPATITLTASASDLDGTITKVEFFQGASLVGTATTVPYTVTLTGVAAGSYSYTAKATDNAGLNSTSSAVAVAVNAPPSVAITAPANGTAFASPGGFTLTADASDSDGSIAKVEFFQGATLVGTATAAPYSAGVSGLATGSYTFTAKATDNLGAATTSTAVQIVVSAAPTVSITAPANNAVYPAPASVTLTATASDPDGTIAKVEFYQGATLVSTVTTAPYSATLSNLAAGTYVFTTKATDNVGLTTTSAAVSVIVNALPTVSLTAPANGATFTAPATINLSATANDADGTIAKVEFFQGSTLIGTVTAAPYNFSWTNVAQGSYSVTAKATDDRGLSTTSAAVAITVKAPAQLHYIHPDQLGTPRMITRVSDNTPVWRWDNTEPFGNSQPNENPSGLGAFAFNLRFPGQYFDTEIGTHYNYFRTYDPSTGRYLESDPIGLGGGINTFAYVSANVVTRSDRRGLAGSSCCTAAQSKGLFKNRNGTYAGGIVACCSGKKFACAQPLSGPGASIVSKCIVAHEEEHFPDVDCPPCDPGPTRPDFRNSGGDGPKECIASRVEVECLKKNQHECGGNPGCIRQVDESVAIVTRYGRGFGVPCGI